MKRISCAMVLSAAAVQLVSMSAQAAPKVALLTPGKLANTVRIVGSMIPDTNLPSVNAIGNLSVNTGLRALPPFVITKPVQLPAPLGTTTVSDVLTTVERTRLAQTPINGVAAVNTTLVPVAATVIKIESRLP